MLRLFLTKKMFAGRSKVNKGERKRNRRIFERFDVDYKHLTMLNEQDILVVRDLSAKGFSTQVSERGFQRFRIGDIYAAKMRYLGEIFDIAARVTWKNEDTVGFELVEPSKQTLNFMRRLLKPIEIAASLRRVDSSFMANNTEGKTWYHGDNDTDLYIYRNEAGELSAWQLILGNEFVEWSELSGLSTGEVKSNNSASEVIGQMTARSTVSDQKLNDSRRKLALDVLMALEIPDRDQILPTIAGRE